MNKQIYFDSSDWNSIRDIIEKVNESGEMQFGATEEGETIIFDVGRDEDGNDYLITDVLQHNGWWRKNYYHPDSYIIEETYHKDKK